MKLVPQSLYIAMHRPRRDKNCCDADKKVSEDKSLANSKCNAFVAKQTNKQIYAFVVRAPRWRPRVYIKLSAKVDTSVQKCLGTGYTWKWKICHFWLKRFGIAFPATSHAFTNCRANCTSRRQNPKGLRN